MSMQRAHASICHALNLHNPMTACKAAAPNPALPPQHTDHEGQELEDVGGLLLRGVLALRRADHLLADVLQGVKNEWR